MTEVEKRFVAAQIVQRRYRASRIVRSLRRGGSPQPAPSQPTSTRASPNVPQRPARYASDDPDPVGFEWHSCLTAVFSPLLGTMRALPEPGPRSPPPRLTSRQERGAIGELV